MTILDKIVTNKKSEVALRKKSRPQSLFVEFLAKSDRSFISLIKKSRKVNLIAEIKKSAPSAGKLRKDEEILGIVEIYNKYANAISVVTDEKFFDGSLDLMKQVRENTELPVLCKDFIVDEYQIFEASAYGADAILLICSVLDLNQINTFISTAKKLGMDAILEVRNEKEMQIAINSKAKIIGVNNRNLDDFLIDLSRTRVLTSLLEGNRVFVSESGILTNKNLQEVENNVDCVLIGTAFMKADNIEKKIIEIMNI